MVDASRTRQAIEDVGGGNFIHTFAQVTAGLDPIAATAFDELVLYLRETLRLTVVMVTHDLDTLARTCDRVAVLVDRRIVVDTREGIVSNEHPWIQQYFHGKRGRAMPLQQEGERGA